MSPSFDSIRSRWASSSGESLLLTRLDAPGVLGGKSDETAKEAFKPAKDYPRRIWRPDTAIPKNPPAVTTTWELDGTDMAALEQRFGEGTIRDRRFTASKGYDNVTCFDLSINQASLVKKLIADAKVVGQDRKPLTYSKTPEAATKALEAIASLTPAQTSLLNTLRQEYPEVVDRAPSPPSRIPRSRRQRTDSGGDEAFRERER